MSTSSSAVISTTPRLPAELLFQIASEVAEFRTSPLDDRNRSIPYAEWVASVTAVNQLMRAGSSSLREELHRVWSPRWTLWRIETKPFIRVGLPDAICPWAVAPNMQYSPAVPKIDSNDQSFILGSAPDRIVGLAPKKVINLVLKDDDWSQMMLFVKYLAWNCRVGFRHIAHRHWNNGMPAWAWRSMRDEWDWKLLDASEFRECVRVNERLPLDGYHNRSFGPFNFLSPAIIKVFESWPFVSVTDLTVVLRNHSCLGFPLETRESPARMSHDFSSGLCLHLPDFDEMEAAADVLVNLYPRLERLTITRAPIADSVSRNWGPQPLNPEDSALCDVRVLFGEPSISEHSKQNWMLQPLKFEHPAICDVRTLFGEPSVDDDDDDDCSAEYCTEADDHLLMPIKVGADFAGTVRVEEIPRELVNVDEVFLRLVHDKIAERPPLPEVDLSSSGELYPSSEDEEDSP